MARSNVYTYTLARDKIIQRAFQLINVYDLNETPQNNDVLYASDILNGMVKAWEADGIHLWKRRQATLFPALDDHEYSIGSTGWHCTNSYVSTTLSGDEASGQTTLSVTSSTGMTASDYIGIELDDGSRQWTTISSVPSSTSVIVSVALTGAAESGNTVLSYTSKINRPLRILRATTMDLDNDSNEVMMSMYSYDEYFNLPLKSTEGRPNNYYYDKLLDNGTLYVYPEPQNVNTLINFTYDDCFQDFTTATDSPDFPQEWIYPLVVNLAVELAYAYGKFVELERLEPKAEKLKMTLESFDGDEEPLTFRLDLR